MAHGGTDKYYNPANKVVNDGDTAFADDVNNINYAVDTALARVADDLDVMDVKVTTLSSESEAWAHNDQGIPPDPLEPTEFSSKAYATESKEYAIQAEGVVIHKADGTTQLIDSAYVSATKAAASQAAALASKNAAALSESNAEAHSLQAWADQQVAFESMQDAQAAASAAAVSAANLPNATTAGVDKIPVTNSSGDGWDYVSRVGLGRKNLLINGGFDVWQRGTSFNVGNSYKYTADRWYALCVGMGAGTIFERGSFTIGQGDVPSNPTHYLRCTMDAGPSPTSGVLQYLINNVALLSGREVTLSFYAKADAAKYIAINAVQFFGSGGPGTVSAYEYAEKTTLSTSWVRKSFTFTMPSVSGKTIGTGDTYTAIYIFMSHDGAPVSGHPSGSEMVDQEGVFDFANVQLEFGDTATDFEYRHPAEELMLCKQFYRTGTLRGPFSQYATNYAVGPFISFDMRRAPDLTLGALTTIGHDGTPGTLYSDRTSSEGFNPVYNWTGGTIGRSFFGQFTWTADAEIY